MREKLRKSEGGVGTEERERGMRVITSLFTGPMRAM